MLHDHHNATRSEEADQIESEIDTGLQKFGMLLSEMHRRIQTTVKPEKILSKRWVWIVFLTLFISCKIYFAINKKNHK